MKGLMMFWGVIYFAGFATAQTDKALKDKEINAESKVFLPSLEMGYISYASRSLRPGLLIKTSVEYRFRLQNAAFFRLNFDNRDARYAFDLDQLPGLPSLTNVVEGTARFTDLIFGPGYRWGEKSVQLFGLVQYGMTFYTVPKADIHKNNILLRDESTSSPILRSTLGLEYYLDMNTAITLEFMHLLFFGDSDFWQSSPHAAGISIGVTTAF